MSHFYDETTDVSALRQSILDQRKAEDIKNLKLVLSRPTNSEQAQVSAKIALDKLGL